MRSLEGWFDYDSPRPPRAASPTSRRTPATRSSSTAPTAHRRVRTCCTATTATPWTRRPASPTSTASPTSPPKTKSTAMSSGRRTARPRARGSCATLFPALSPATRATSSPPSASCSSPPATSATGSSRGESSPPSRRATGRYGARAGSAPAVEAPPGGPAAGRRPVQASAARYEGDPHGAGAQAPQRQGRPALARDGNAVRERLRRTAQYVLGRRTRVLKRVERAATAMHVLRGDLHPHHGERPLAAGTPRKRAIDQDPRAMICPRGAALDATAVLDRGGDVGRSRLRGACAGGSQPQKQTFGVDGIG